MALFKAKNDVPSADKLFACVRDGYDELTRYAQDDAYTGPFKDIIRNNDDILDMTGLLIFVAVSFPCNNDALVQQVLNRLQEYAQGQKITPARFERAKRSLTVVEDIFDNLIKGELAFIEQLGFINLCVSSASILMGRTVSDTAFHDAVSKYLLQYVAACQKKLET